MSEISDKMEKYVESEIGNDIKTLIAFTIRKTKTLKDDEIIDNIDEVKDIVSDAIDDIADVTPTEQEAKEAVMRTLKLIVSLTPNKWDDRIISLIDLVL
jgi:hypothetical protein